MGSSCTLAIFKYLETESSNYGRRQASPALTNYTTRRTIEKMTVEY